MSILDYVLSCTNRKVCRFLVVITPAQYDVYGFGTQIPGHWLTVSNERFKVSHRDDQVLLPHSVSGLVFEVNASYKIIVGFVVVVGAFPSCNLTTIKPDLKTFLFQQKFYQNYSEVVLKRAGKYKRSGPFPSHFEPRCDTL